MKKIVIYLIICLSVISCNKNEDSEYLRGADKFSAQCLNEGVEIYTPESTIINLSLDHQPGVMKVTANEQWVDIAKVTPNESQTHTDIEILLSKYNGWTIRKAIASLAIAGVVKEIHIIQHPMERIENSEPVYYIGNEGGEITVPLKSNAKGELNVRLNYPDKSDWATFEDITTDNINPEDPKHTLTLKASANDGLGRICQVRVSVAKSDAYTSFCLVQLPHRFNEEETIAIDNAGSLDILLGNEVENIRRIRNLILTGYMNSVDLAALRQMFYQGVAADPEPGKFPVDLNLKKVTIVTGKDSHYSHLGYRPATSEYIVMNDNEIPDHTFERCSNLTAIALPENAIRIGTSAIARNNLLRSVDIPDNVEIIGYGAFQGCRNLCEVNISDNSRLRQLGRYAFSGCGPIEYLNLPVSLIKIEAGYLNLTVNKLRVHWTVPPELRVPPTVKGEGILYVPSGTSLLYKESFGWNRFPNIVEYSE